jgi:hypothetical protein
VNNDDDDTDFDTKKEQDNIGTVQQYLTTVAYYNTI